MNKNVKLVVMSLALVVAVSSVADAGIFDRFKKSKNTKAAAPVAASAVAPIKTAPVAAPGANTNAAGVASAPIPVMSDLCMANIMKSDFAKALPECKKSAEKGNAQAAFQIAVLYMNGQGVAKNDKESLVWLNKALEQGMSEASFLMGNIYANGGVGVDKDANKALTLLTPLAAKRHIPALMVMSNIYANGAAGEKNLVEAYKFLSLANINNDKFIEAQLANMAKNMKPDELTKAKKSAQEWLAKNNMK